MSLRASSVWFLVSHSSPGGVQELWANLAAGFAARGINAQLLSLYPSGDEPRASDARLPWRYVVPERPSGPVQILGLLFALVRSLRRERPDMVITAMPAANVLAPLSGLLSGTSARFILTHHSPADTHNPVLDRLDSLTGCIPQVRHIVSVSAAVSTSLDAKPAAYRKKRVVIHNALPPAVERLLAELAVKRRLSAIPDRTIVAVGRLSEQKNYPFLIRSMAHMPQVKLKIIGDGPDRAALEVLASERGVQDRVEFQGHVPRMQALQRLAQTSAFVQVSRYEGHSLALIEAAKLGLPLIVSNVPVQVEGVTSEDGSRCGLIVDLDDDEALSRAVLSVVDDAETSRSWSEKAEKLGAESSFEAMVAAYENLAG